MPPAIPDTVGMARAQFHKNQRVYVRPVGTWAQIERVVPHWTKGLEEPIRMIAQNAGVEGSIIVAKVKESKDKNFGYNAQTDVFEDLVAAGVIDPTKVTRTALQNAASIAALLLTTECVVVEKKEKDKSPQMPGGGGMGGMY